MRATPPTRPRIRTWSDEHLRTAVARERSWRGVARALGLRESSTNNVRHHAARLGLDTSHFTGRRQWTDQQLRDAVAKASSWAEVLHGVGVVDNGASRARVKGHALRLGLDQTHLAPWPHDDAGNAPIPRAPQRSLLRNAAVSIAVAWFALRGMDTALPTEPRPYDLLAALPEGIRRVQVKSGARRDSNGRWSVKVSRRPYSLDKRAGRAPYDPDSIDFFFIVDGSGGLYLIPVQVLGGRVEIGVNRYQSFRVGDASSLLA